MRVLFDHNMPRRFRKHLVGHIVRTTREMTWDELENGALLAAAANAAFEVFLSIDKKLEYEQNLRNLPLPVIVLNSRSNALPYLLPFIPATLQLLASPLLPVLYFVEPDGTTR